MLMAASLNKSKNGSKSSGRHKIDSKEVERLLEAEFPDDDGLNCGHIPLVSDLQGYSGLSGINDDWETDDKTTSEIINKINSKEYDEVVILDYSCTVFTTDQQNEFVTSSIRATLRAGGSKSKKRKRKSNKTRKRRRKPSKPRKHKKSKKPKTKRNPNKRKTKRK